MHIAVISDIHDNIWNLERALEMVKKYQPQALLMLGDLCSPFIVAQLAKAIECPIHIVFGNNDGDTFLISKVASDFTHVMLHGQFAEFEFGGRRIAINHYPDISERIAQSGVYDAVFSGHDHKRYTHTFGKTLWANPGEIMGRFGKPSFGVYETEAHTFTHVDVPPLARG